MKTFLAALVLFATVITLAYFYLPRHGAARSDVDQRYCLSASVKVNPHNPSSGTIVKSVKLGEGEYLNYILSTGHMQTRENIAAVFYYQNDEKLDLPIRVEGGQIVLLIENGLSMGVDFSIVKITTAFPVNAATIAPPTYQLKGGLRCVSIGCDLGSDPSIYESEVIGLCPIEPKGKRLDWEWKRDHPKAGRSGGGIFVQKTLVGVCWGGRPAEYTNRGMFTPHTSIWKMIDAAGLSEELK